MEVPNHQTLSHASYHQLTCLIVHWRSWTPAVYHHGLRSRHPPSEPHDGTIDPHRHQQQPTLLEPPLCLAGHKDWRAPLVLPPGGRGQSGRTTTPHPPQPSPPCLTNPTDTVHAFTIPGPSSGVDDFSPPPPKLTGRAQY